MDWRELIGDFNGLVTEVVQRNSRNKVAKLLSHDPKTINSWLQGGEPSDARDVAEVIRQALLSGIDLSRFQSYAPIYDLSPLLNYEQTVQKTPADFAWLTSARRAPVVKTEFCGIDLDCPLGVASSPLVADDRWAELMLNLGFGLSTFKTKRATQKEAWSPPFIAFVLEPPDLTNYDARNPQQVLVSLNRNEIRDSIPSLVNSIGVPSEVTTAWQDMYQRIKRHPRGRLMGLSVMGDGGSGVDLAKDIEVAIDKAKEVNPTFIELNLSCPNLENGVDFCVDISLIEQITKRARTALRGTPILLVLKLPGFSPRLLEDVLKGAGKNIDAVAFRNTTRVRPVTKDRDGRMHSPFPGREFGGLSGPCTFETTRRGVHNLVTIRARLGQEFNIVAVGGVATFGNAIELLDAGADVVQACTAPIFDPLLAWKVRFHMHQFERKVGVEAATALLQPRNQAEIDSFRNAFEAYSQIQRRYPARAVPYEIFQQKWNDWLEHRPSSAIGKAHRMPAPRTFEEWIRDLPHDTDKKCQHQTPKRLKLVLKKSAQALLATYAPTGPPYDPRLIAEKLGIAVQETQLTGVEGYLDTSDGRYIAVISSTAKETRRRFTLAHELCHVLLMQRADDGKPVRLIRFRSNGSLPGLHQDPVEESLCDYFAGELLIPSDEISKRLAGREIVPTTTYELADEYQVSIQAAAIQIVRALSDHLLACSYWNLESLWPIPVWWTGCRTRHTRELRHLEILVERRMDLVEL